MTYIQGTVILIRFTANEKLDLTKIPSTIKFTSSRGPVFDIPTELPNDSYGEDTIEDNEFTVTVDTNNYNFLAGYGDAIVSIYGQADDLAGNTGTIDPSDSNNTFTIEDYTNRIILQKVYTENSFELKLVFSAEIDKIYGEDVDNYSIEYEDESAPYAAPNPKTVQVSSAKVDSNVVILTTTEQTPDVRYKVNYNVVAKRE